eukprot:Em0133g3a
MWGSVVGRKWDNKLCDSQLSSSRSLVVGESVHDNAFWGFVQTGRNDGERRCIDGGVDGCVAKFSDGESAETAEAEERRRDEAEEEEKRRRFEEERRRQEESERQLALIAKLLEKTTLDGPREQKPRERDAQVVRLMEKDDIETGRAQEVYGSLSSEQAADYDLLKEAILNRYGIREETYRQRFRSTKKTGNETYRELGSKLKDTAKKWLRECETSGFVRESQGRATKRSSWLTTSCRLGSVEASKAQRIAAEEKKTLEESVSVGDNDASSVEKRGTACAARCGRDWKDEDRKKESLISSSSKILKCYHCGKAGHVARNCPESALFSESGRKDRIRERNVTREGTVEGTKVQDILLDTGCSRTMIRKGLVPPSKWLPDQAVTIRCAHGDTMVYPLALVELNVEAVLLGRDVSELDQLLNQKKIGAPDRLQSSDSKEEVMAVTTRSRARQEASLRKVGEIPTKQLGQQSTEVDPCTQETEQWDVGNNLDEELFEKNEKPRKENLSRAQKRAIKRKFRETENADERWKSLDIGAKELQTLQEKDKTLENVRKLVQEGDPCFVRKASRIYHKSLPGKERLVLPQQCRDVVLKLAHEAPLAGHMGRNKTTKPVLQRFYWPNVYKDVVCEYATRYPKAIPR